MHKFIPGLAPLPEKKKKQQGKSSVPRSVPWVEKYRPKTMDDVAYQDEVVRVLKKTICGFDFPNLLFYGPPGTGKTSTILAAARQMFGSEMYRQRVLELNASDERGIDVVRHKVKDFSQLTAGCRRPDGKQCPPLKIVILDEADSMTTDAQSALRRTMEKQAKTTRFCLICNYVSRIIEPITSRCAKFRFKPLISSILKKRLEDIAEEENVNIDALALLKILEIADGDMRKAITTLQSVARLKPEGEAVTKEDILEICGVVPDDIVDSLLDASKSGSYERVRDAVKAAMIEGYAASTIINQVHDRVVFSESLTDIQKAHICEKLSDVEHCLSDGADEYLQIMDLLTYAMKPLTE